MRSNKYKQYFERICNKAVNQASINQTELKKTKITIPTLKEQEEIADFLTTLDDKINIAERKLEQAKTFKKALLQRMFV
jgi:type I restriction enzyme S subunit